MAFDTKDLLAWSTADEMIPEPKPRRILLVHYATPNDSFEVLERAMNHPMLTGYRYVNMTTVFVPSVVAKVVVVFEREDVTALAANDGLEAPLFVKAEDYGVSEPVNRGGRPVGSKMGENGKLILPTKTTRVRPEIKKKKR